MTHTEALRLALEALEYFSDTSPNMAGKAHAEDAITAIKAALLSRSDGEAKDEFVEFFDWYDNAHWGNEDFKEGCHRAWNAAIKYTTPPQRKPLTDEDIRQANHHMVCGAYDYSFKQGVRWAEKVHGIKWEWEK